MEEVVSRIYKKNMHYHLIYIILREAAATILQIITCNEHPKLEQVETLRLKLSLT